VSIPKIIVVLILTAVVPVCAATIIASGAGALPGSAEDLTSVFPTEIIGAVSDITDPLLGVNMFAINILNPAAFSAVVVGSPFGIPDTVLSLFDSTGVGVYLNDDMGGSDPLAYTLSCLPSVIANPCPSAQPPGVGPMSVGVYYLAVSVSSNYPVSSTGEIFSPALSTDVVGPDPLNGGPNPITGWDGFAFTGPDPDLSGYDIILTGTTPEPSTWIMTGIACILLALLRRNSANSRGVSCPSEPPPPGRACSVRTR
jgi:hypothetical protein